MKAVGTKRPMSDNDDLTKPSSALTVLQALDFVGSAKSRTLTETIAHLQRPKSTVLRILDTLVRSGFVRRIAPGEYGVTLKLWRLGSQAVQATELQTLVLPAMRRMTIETAESSLFAVYEAGFSVFMEKIDSPQPVAANVTIGSRAPAYATATGKSMLAYQSEEEIERVIHSAKRCSSRTITDRKLLHKELGSVRQRRLAFSMGEWREDIAGAAGPVFNHSGEVIGAIGISCPLGRVRQRLETLGKIVHATAAELSARLGA